jgi:hypothetical protein
MHNHNSYQVAVKEVICHAERNAVKRSISEILRYAQNDMIERNLVSFSLIKAIAFTQPSYTLRGQALTFSHFSGLRFIVHGNQQSTMNHEPLDKT